MNRLLITSIFIIFEIINCSGQGTWTKFNKVVPENIWSIHFSDEIHGYITCSKNKIYRTSNGGINWIDVSPKFNASSGCWYSGIYCLDSNTVFAGTYCDSFIVRSSDGGATWDSINIAFQPLKIYFVPKTNIGFVITNSELYFTSDRGLNWTKKSNTTLFLKQSMLFINDSIGFLGGTGNKIYKTIDQGLTWNQYNTGMNDGTNDIYFFNNQHGIVVDGNVNWAITYNQGLTWNTYSNSNDGNQVGVYFVNNDVGFKIMSNALNIKYSSNGGITWNIVNNTNGDGKNGMSFPSKCAGYVAEITGSIFKYSNPNCNIVGMDNSFDKKSDIILTPNPADKYFKISYNKVIKSYYVVDYTGRTILQGEYSNKGVNIEDLPSGIYLVQVVFDDNKIAYAKFLKD